MRQLFAFAVLVGLQLATSATADEKPATTAPSIRHVEPVPAMPDTVAYCCLFSDAPDADVASMKQQLRAATARLQPSQKFAIVCAQKSDPVASNDNLVPASPENIQAASDWIDKLENPSGIDPLPAIRKAFRMHSAVLHLVVDGDRSDLNAVRDEITTLNAQHKTHVIVIAFRRYTDAGLDILKNIAVENDGQIRIYSADAPKK